MVSGWRGYRATADSSATTRKPDMPEPWYAHTIRAECGKNIKSREIFSGISR